MEMSEKVTAIEEQLNSQRKRLRAVSGALVLMIAFLITRWILGIEGRLELQGKRVYVHKGGEPLVTSTVLPYGLATHKFVDASNPYGKHAVFEVTTDKTYLLLRDDASSRKRDLELFVNRDKSGLSIRDDQQRERVSLFLAEDGPMLILYNEEGQVVFQAP